MSQNESQLREQVVLSILNFTEGTRLQASAYERHLLAEYVQGRLTLEQVEALLASQCAAEQQVCPL